MLKGVLVKQVIPYKEDAIYLYWIVIVGSLNCSDNFKQIEQNRGNYLIDRSTRVKKSFCTFP